VEITRINSITIKSSRRLNKLGESKNEDMLKYLDNSIKEDLETIQKDLSIKTDKSGQKVERTNKNKAFQEEIQNESKEMIRAISHVSFTNQTDMFDHYDSQNSFNNNKLTGLTNFEVVESSCKELDESNAPDDGSDQANIQSSFLNLRTCKNKFFENGMSEENISTINDRIHTENVTEHSMIEMIKNYNNKQADYFSFDTNEEKLRETHDLPITQSCNKLNLDTFDKNVVYVSENEHQNKENKTEKETDSMNYTTNRENVQTPSNNPPFEINLLSSMESSIKPEFGSSNYYRYEG